MYGYVRLCRAMHGYERHGTAMQGYAGLCRAMYGYERLFRAYVRLCTAM